MNVSAVRAIVQGVCVASFVAVPATMRDAVIAPSVITSICLQGHLLCIVGPYLSPVY